MSTLRVSNIEAKADASSPTIDEKVKVTSSQGRVLVQIDGKTAGITSIGINTTSTSFTIDANQNVQFVGGITAANVNTTGVSTFTSLSLGAGTSISSPATNVIAFGTNNGESVRIDPNGRIGINTNNPGRALHIQGNGAAEQVWEQGDGKANRKKFNLVVDGGNSTTDSTIYLRHLNDNYTAGNAIWSYVGAGGTHRFYNRSGSVVQTLYNDGNVQKPLQSFCDTGDTTSYGAAGSLCASPSSAKGNWSSTVTNVGNNFSTSTDLYTCPVAGAYAVSCTCSIDNLTPTPYRTIFVLSFNGGYEEITELFDTYENQSPCVIRYRNANDTIGLGINGAGGSSFHVRLQVYFLG
jgi:hypothetical protein